MEEKKFRLITAIDRINYFSDNFIAYYKKWFLDEEFYFMVHEKSYDEIKGYLFSKGFGPFNIEKYNIMTFGEGHNIGNQNRIKTEFLNQGYIVVYADMDERIYHPDLRNYILSKRDFEYIIPQGMQVIHTKDEPQLDFTKNIIEQRSTCVIDIFWYSKVCILGKDFKWDHGRHNKPHRHTIDRNIHLIDVGKSCKSFMIENNKISSEIYNKVMWRYKETNQTHIDREVYDKLTLHLQSIDRNIKNANPF